MSAPPTGTITLVFTDIQGSTALWEHFDDAFKAVLDQHNALFRVAIAEFGGYEVKTEGDAFMVAFGDAASAVAMCLAIQARLHAAHWPDSLNDAAIAECAGSTEDGVFHGVRVRIGVHTGTPDCQPDPVTGRMDYFGRMVNRAARVSSVGHGGQVLVSEATWDALGSALPEGTAVVDLGEHALKGIERRAHLRQLLPRVLAARTFPRLETPNLAKTNLPTRLDSFFGREAELAELERRIADGQRLITVMGAGGTGKTRLSQRFGGTQLASFRGGVWFCDLCEARTQAGVLTAVGTALEVPLTGKDPEAQLANAILGRGRVLIILDNFEQVVEHAPETVGRWLQRSPEAVFLVTSRTLLRIAGEALFYLDPLRVPEAVSLFYDRARAGLPGFVRTGENEAVVTEIVERLDCLSLAVELAAARVRMMSPEKIHARLSQRFQLLRGQRRDQTARQATLRGAIDWSWALLEPHARSALAQLSMFHGGCTLEAAETVVDLDAFDDAPWVMDVVEALVDHSLLRRVEPHPGCERYRMLESIREYAAEELGAEGEATALRHAEHFASFGDEAFIESLYTHGGVARRRALGLEVENLAAGVEAALAVGETDVAGRCALAAGEVFGMHGPFSEGLALLKRVPTHAVGGAVRARVFKATAWLLAPAGMSEALAPFHEAVEAAREVGHRREEGVILGNLGNLYRTEGRVSEALAHYQEALAIAREVGDRRGEGVVLGDLAFLDHQQGRVVESLAHYDQALAISREVGDRRNEGMTHGGLGMLHRQQGRLEQAQAHCLNTLSIERELGDRRNEGMTLGSLAILNRQRGRMGDALAHFQESLAIHREVGNRRGEGITLGNLGDLLFEEGDLTAAETHFQQAIAICDEVWPMAAGAFRGSLGLIRGQQGAFDEARALFAKGDDQLRGVYALELGKFLCKRAQTEHLAGDPNAAATALTEAEAIAAELGVAPDSELGEALAKAAGLVSSCRAAEL